MYKNATSEVINSHEHYREEKGWEGKDEKDGNRLPVVGVPPTW